MEALLNDFGRVFSLELAAVASAVADKINNVAIGFAPALAATLRIGRKSIVTIRIPKTIAVSLHEIALVK